jgi:hypothetical protein
MRLPPAVYGYRTVIAIEGDPACRPREWRPA